MSDPQAPSPSPSPLPAAGVTIDELARESGMTARNIRAHQSRGLLPPPDVRARTGYYGPEHLNRIRLIQDLQGQGFNLRSIEKLLEVGTASGSPETLEFQRTVLKPFGSEQPETVDAEGLVETFGDPLDRELIAKAERIGLLIGVGEDTWEVPSPTMLRAGRELAQLGIPREHALAVAETINEHTAAISEEFVRLFLQDVLDPIRERKHGAGADLTPASQAVDRLRPLASEAVLAGFGLAMTRAVERQLERELR